MSSFLSNKLLRYRGLTVQPPHPIDHDQLCTTCGYNLRGLITGRPCPECGQCIGVRRAIEDPLLTGELSQRRMVQIGLTLVALCPVLAALTRLALMTALAFSPGAASNIPYIVRGFIVSAIWIVGVWLVTPQRLQMNHPRLTALRRSARVTAPLWIAVYLFWLLAETKFAFTVTGDKLLFWALICSIPAALGVCATGAWLVVLADDAGLSEAADRMNLSLWVASILTAVVFLMPLDMPFFMLAILAIVLLPWACYLTLFALGVWEMQRHMSWAMRMATDGYGRDFRMSQTRRELERQANAKLRPLPPQPDNPDLPVMKSLDRQ